MHLFYIETEDFLKVVFEVLLKKEQHTIFTTGDLDSFHLIDDQKPHVVLISLNYPFNEINNLVELIRGISNYKPILVMIGDENQVMQMNEKKIFDYYLVKPIAPLEALEQLESYLVRK